MIRRTLAARFKRIRRAEPEDAERLADLHKACFQPGWSSEDFSLLLRQPANRSWVILIDPPGTRLFVGALLCTLAADEAEMVTLFIKPSWHRSGLAAQLLATAREELFHEGACSWHLEVDEHNQSAIELYRRFGFFTAGRRKAYYQGGEAHSDALMLRRSLP